MSMFIRAGLGVAVLWAVASERVSAQAPESIIVVHPHETSAAAPATVIEAVPAHRGIRLARWPFGRDRAADTRLGDGRLGDGHAKERLSQCGYCCKSHLDWYGCNTLRTEIIFVLGSCRTFFGEPCEPSDPLRHGRGNGAALDYNHGNGNRGCIFCK